LIDLAELTIHQAQTAFAAGTLTAEALTLACLAQIARWNPAYNALIYLNERIGITNHQSEPSLPISMRQVARNQPYVATERHQFLCMALLATHTQETAKAVAAHGQRRTWRAFLQRARTQQTVSSGPPSELGKSGLFDEKDSMTSK